MQDDKKTKRQLIDELNTLRAALKQLRQEGGETQYRAMFEHMANGFALYEAVDNGRDFVFKEYNPAAVRMNGVAQKDVIGKPLSQVFPEILDQPLFKALQRVWRSGQSERLPATWYKQSPLRGWREYVIYKLPSGDVAAIIDDVTEREQANHEAKRKAAFLQATLDAVNDGIWEYSLVDDSFNCSDRLAEMIGCSTDQLSCMGPLCRDRLHPDDVPIFDNALNQCVERDCDRLSLELRLRSEDGQWKWFYARGSVVERDTFGRPSRIIGAHTDLTEHKRAEQRLRESLELFSTIFENAYTPMLLIHPDDGRIVEANAKACELYGYVREVLKSMTILDINALPPEMIHEEMERAKAAKRTYFQFKHRLASGELRDVEVHSGPVHIHGRDLLYSIIHDVTEQRIQEEALHRSETALSSIFRAAPIGMGTVRDRVLVKINDQLCKMVGRDLDELHGQSARILYPNDAEFERVGRVKHPMVEKHGLGTIETRFLHADGHVLNILMSSSWLDPLDHESGLVFTALDITDRYNAETKLTQTRRALLSLVDSMPSAIFALDTAGTIRLANVAGSKLTGMDVKQLKGQRLSRLLPGLQGFQQILAETIASDTPSTRKELPFASNGQLTFFDMLIYPVNNAALGRAVVRLDDVTERVRMAESMIQNEKMISVGGLAAGMAHEINNPLAGVLQGAQNILRRLDPELPANRRAAEQLGVDLNALRSYMDQRKIIRFLAGITESGQRAAGIVSDMLDFSRSGGAGHQPLSLHDCIEGSIRLARKGFEFEGNYDFRHIRIVRSYATEMPDIQGHESELRQVFLNLLANAAHAMRDKTYRSGIPSITITTGVVGHQAVVEVEDNGPGISELNRPRIFDPFYTTKSPGKGTGLGLSVSYFIVTRNHGGSITVESTPGEFTRFTIKLPLQGVPANGFSRS